MPDETLAKYWCLFNSWRIPKRFEKFRWTRQRMYGAYYVLKVLAGNKQCREMWKQHIEGAKWFGKMDSGIEVPHDK